MNLIWDRMILQILQVTVLDIATHKIGNPASLLTADLNDNDQTRVAITKDVLQPKVSGIA
jgi:Na+/pantothenate symporter